MNVTELVELYFQDKASEDQIRQLIEWLEKDKENIKNFIREANDHKNIKDFFASKKISFEDKIEGKNILKTTGEQQEDSDELPFKELKQAAGGKADQSPKQT